MVVDLFLVYNFIKRLATPFNKWDAYKEGVIDEKGNILKKRKDRNTRAEQDSFGKFDLLVLKLKKLLEKIPGGSSRLASYAAALWLIKEWKHFSQDSMLNESVTEEQIDESIDSFYKRYSYYIKLEEDVNGLVGPEYDLFEKLKASDDMGDWIDDFYKSDAPQFKGKSKAKRRQMAIAAKLDAMDESINIDEARGSVKPPRWKRAGPNGELEIKFPTGRMFKIEKNLDENGRHKGEWKVMEYKTGSWVDDWEWVDTYKPKGFAKQKAMQLGQFDKRGKKVADYSSTFQYESVQEEHPNCGTPDCCGQCETANVTEAPTQLRTLKLINKIKKSGVVKTGSMKKESFKPHPDVVKAHKKLVDADDKAAEYNHRGNKARVTRAQNHMSKMINKHHPDLDMKGKIKLRTALQNMNMSEEPTTSVAGGHVAGLGVGPQGEPGLTPAQMKKYKDKNKKNKKLRDVLGSTQGN